MTIIETGRPAAPVIAGVGGYELRLASCEDEILAAAALRERVFGAELGAITPGPAGTDLDEFDAHCDHLIVWHRDSPDYGDSLDPSHRAVSGEQAVATYRLLPPERNLSRPRSAGLYANSEFDVSPLEKLLDSTIEAGRACVDAAHRGSPAITLLWAGIARHMLRSGSRYLIGCAGIPLSDGGGQAALFDAMARTRYRAPENVQCRSRSPLPELHAALPDRLSVPPLLLGYLRLGALICSPGAWDRHFNSADYLILLDLQQADSRYLRRFVHDAGV